MGLELVRERDYFRNRATCIHLIKAEIHFTVRVKTAVGDSIKEIN